MLLETLHKDRDFVSRLNTFFARAMVENGTPNVDASFAKEVVAQFGSDQEIDMSVPFFRDHNYRVGDLVVKKFPTVGYRSLVLGFKGLGEYSEYVVHPTTRSLPPHELQILYHTHSAEVQSIIRVRYLENSNPVRRAFQRYKPKREVLWSHKR